MSYSVITIDKIKDDADISTIKLLRSVAEKCKSKLTEGGATRFVCTVSRSTNNEFNVDGGVFSLFRTVFADGLSITCYIGDKKGSASLNSSLTDDANITAAVETALDGAKAAEPDPDWEVAPNEGSKIFLKGNLDFDRDGLFDRLEEAMDTIKDKYPLVLVEQAIANHARSISLFFTSSGSEFITISGSYGVDFMYSAHDGDNASSFFGSGFTLEQIDKPFVETGSFAESLENIQKQVYTKPFKGKKTGRLITTPDLSSELIFSAINNFAGEYNILNGTAVWLDKIGKKVADERLTVTCATNDPRFVGGQTYTGEGYLTKDYNIIDNGVLTSFDISAYTANKKGLKMAPNAGYNPIINAGTKSIKDIIAETEFGIYVARFSGGEPAINGDFSGVAKNSFLIENGKITSALSETMISGNLEAILNNIVDISSEQEMDGTSVLPYICFDGVTISGE